MRLLTYAELAWHYNDTKKYRVRDETAQIPWSAPAERSGDGALGRARIAGSIGSSATIHDKAVSRFACHRTPWGLAPFSMISGFLK
jgi:hypothetical protein